MQIKAPSVSRSLPPAAWQTSDLVKMFKCMREEETQREAGNLAYSFRWLISWTASWQKLNPAHGVFCCCWVFQKLSAYEPSLQQLEIWSHTMSTSMDIYMCTCRWLEFSLVLLLGMMWRKHLRSDTSSHTDMRAEGIVRLIDFFFFLFFSCFVLLVKWRVQEEWVVKEDFPIFGFCGFYSKKMPYFKRDINKEFHNLIPKRLIILILRWFLNITDIFLCFFLFLGFELNSQYWSISSTAAFLLGNSD